MPSDYKYEADYTYKYASSDYKYQPAYAYAYSKDYTYSSMVEEGHSNKVLIAAFIGAFTILGKKAFWMNQLPNSKYQRKKWDQRFLKFENNLAFYASSALKVILIL